MGSGNFHHEHRRSRSLRRILLLLLVLLLVALWALVAVARKKQVMRGEAVGSPLEVDFPNSKPNAAGDDNSNLNDEYIVFRVLTSGSLAGYSIRDAGRHRYEFPDRVFTKGQSFALHTGSGTDTPTDLYRGSGRAIWNNDGDTVRLIDPEGRVVLSDSY